MNNQFRITLEDITQLVLGGDWGNIEMTNDYTEKVKVIRGAEYKNWETNRLIGAPVRYIKAKSLESRKLELGDLVIEISGGGPTQPVGRSLVIDKRSLTEYDNVICSNFCRKLRLIDLVDPFFVNYQLKYLYEQGEFDNMQSHTTNLRNLRFKEFLKTNIICPPYNEQKRIVQQLNIIFEKLNQNKVRLELIPKLLKDFRQKVLKAAVTGELTKEWREKNINDFSAELKEFSENEIGWKTILASDACIKVQSGSTPKDNPFTPEGEIPFLKVYNIKDQKIAFDYKPQFISSEIHTSGSMKRSVVEPNDVLMNIVGPPLGKIALVPNDYHQWNINQAIVVFRPKKFLLPKFLYYMLCEGREIENIAFELKGSAGQQNISLSQSRNFTFDIPSINEQNLIISKVEELFNLADTIEQKYVQAKVKIEHLPQAILAKAFRGDLVEQDPNDEPANVLLERIKQAKRKLKK